MSLCVRYFYHFDDVFCLCGGVVVMVVMRGGGGVRYCFYSGLFL